MEEIKDNNNNNNFQIAIASDHAGHKLKELIKTNLQYEGISIKDCGTYNDIEPCDYPDFAHYLAKTVKEYNCIGIAICGTGEGMTMTLNRHKDIRCALCWRKEIAELAREHNDANVLALPARFIDGFTAMEIVHSFLQTEFSGVERHQKRIDKINDL